MKMISKRTISFLLAVAMFFSMLPAFGVLTAFADSPFAGSFDEISCPDAGKIHIGGWGLNPMDLSEQVEIHVYIDGHGYNAGKIGVYRQDIYDIYHGSGNYGFALTLDVFHYGNKTVDVYVASPGKESLYLGSKSVYISPAEPAYGDTHWNLSKHDDCPKVPDGVYRIASAANPNYSLDIVGGFVDYGTNLQLYSNGESDAQLFHLRRIAYQDIQTGNGFLEKNTIVSLMNVNSQLFLDKDSASNNVQQYGDLPDNAYRQWIMRNNNDGTYSFESVAQPGYYMTIEGGMISNSANIGVALWSNSLYQKFYLNAEYVHGDHRLGSLAGFLKSGENRFWNTSTSSRNDTYVLDISGASKDQGTQAQIWTAGTEFTLQQIFDVQKAEDGWYTIRNINSGLYLATANGSAGKNLDAVQQWNTNSDAAKWAFVPRVRTDGTLSYWIVNKATGLYLLHVFAENGSPAGVCSVDNSSVVDNDWRSWGMESCFSQAEINSITNGSTGVAADQFNLSDTISLPIKIFDYNDDGLLFEYTLNTLKDNGGFTLTHASDTPNYPTWAIGQTTAGSNHFLDVNASNDTYFVGTTKFWNSSPDGLNNIYVVNQSAGTGDTIDLAYLTGLLKYSFYGELLSGGATMGLVKPTLREVDGYKLMEYNDEVVAYIADLLDRILVYRDLYNKNEITLENSVQDIPIGTVIETYGNDLAGLLVEQLKANNGNILYNYEADDLHYRRQQIHTDLLETYSKQEDLIGTWDDCKDSIRTYTDAAYFILNNLFYPASYNMPQDKFDYLVLSKATLSNGKTAYVFDSNFSDSYNYVENVTKSAVTYDFTAKTISNSSMLGKPLIRALLTTIGGPCFTFLPVWDEKDVQTGLNNPYSGYFDNKNYNYVLQCNGKFTYTEHDGLFFDFEGDDDVYLFINGQLVLDIGGAHAVTSVKMNLNDYVYAARAAVAAGSTNPRDLALALEDGEDYSFDFYYMERHTSGANMRIATNIRVSDPNMDTDKKAYQNGQELNNGGLVNVDEDVEYSFKLTNPEDSIANLYLMTFADAKLGVTIDSVNGLVVNGTKTLNSQKTVLTAADLKIYFTNQQGTTQEIILKGSTAAEKNAALKAYLKEVNGRGLLPGCSIEIRGIFYDIKSTDFASGRFTNTLHVTANQKADGSGSTYQDSVNMVVCMTSGPQYYQWSGHGLNVTKDKLTGDVNALLTENSPLLEQIAPATSLGVVTNLELCDMKGNVTHSSFVTATNEGLTINYNKPGTYVFYVKVTQSDNSTVIIPVQVNVVDVMDSIFVLDYGLKVNFGDLLTTNDTLSVAGKSTSYTIEAMTVNEPSYDNNHISFSNAEQSVDGTYGDYMIADGSIEYHPDRFMNGADSIYVAIRVREKTNDATTGNTIGTVNINTEVEMYKKITILPANVVYYEDDFKAITYIDDDPVVGDGSGDIFQSADQSDRYGYDDAHESGTTQSGSSAHEISIVDTDTVVQYTFVGTGFELIGRCMDADNCVLYLEVFDADNALVKRIPVILEYDNKVVESNEGIYQVPIVRVDDLPHGQYTVQVHGVPVYDSDDNGGYVVNKTNPPVFYVDGLRIYNPLSMTDSNRDSYLDGEDTASFLEIRNLILEGKVAVVNYNDNDYTITTGTSIFTENRNGVLYPNNTFTITSVAYSGYYVDAPADTEAKETVITLRKQNSKPGFVFTYAKSVDNTDYYYIHISSGDAVRYVKKSADSNTVMLTELSNDDGFLWAINYLGVESGIVTIRNKSDGSYLSASSVNDTTKTGELLALSTETIGQAQHWELGAAPTTSVFEGNIVNSVNDYLVFGPNNELYLDGETTSQALVFYFTPDQDPLTATMLQVGVRVLNDKRLFGLNGDLTPGILYQSANTGTPGYKVLDDNIITSTERYYDIDLSLCKYDETNNRYEVVLYCKNGYLSFTNLKASGGTICTVNGDVADLRYNNGVLELLTTIGESETKTWLAVSNPLSYVNFASVFRQMRASVIYEPDMDTGEFVPAGPEIETDIKLAGRSLLFKDIIKMRFYFDISATGVTNATPENSGLLVWTEEEYAALDRYTVDTAGERIRGLTASVNGHYADTRGIPAKNMTDLLYVRAYVVMPDGSYAYSEVTEFSPVMYAQLVLEKENASQSMKELVIALMNYGAAAQVYFNYETDNLMNAWLTDEQKNYAWNEDMINALPKDTSKYLFAANDQIEWLGSSVTFTGAVNHNFYFRIPKELLQDALTVDLLYWTESDYNELSELTVENARKVAFNVTDSRAVIEGTAAKDLGTAFYFAVHIVYEDGEAFSHIGVDSAHDYARRVLSSNSASDEMKDLAKALVYYSCRAKKQLGG